jgi:hypothetical protein
LAQPKKLPGKRVGEEISDGSLEKMAKKWYKRIEERIYMNGTLEEDNKVIRFRKDSFEFSDNGRRYLEDTPNRDVFDELPDDNSDLAKAEVIYFDSTAGSKTQLLKKVAALDILRFIQNEQDREAILRAGMYFRSEEMPENYPEIEKGLLQLARQGKKVVVANSLNRNDESPYKDLPKKSPNISRLVYDNTDDTYYDARYIEAGEEVEVAA